MIIRTHFGKAFFTFSLTSLMLTFSASAFADDSYNNTFMPDTRFEQTVRGVLTLGGGMAVTSNLGESKYFATQDPVTDQIYNYRPNSPTQTAADGDIFIGIEWLVSPSWALQLGAEYNQTSTYNVKGLLSQGPDAFSETQYNYQYKIQPRQLLGLVKLLYTCAREYHPYIMVAAGTGVNTAYGYTTNVPPTLTYTQEFSNETKHSFSYRVGLGLDVDVASNVRLGVGYAYANFGDVNLGSATIAGVPVSRTLTQNSMGVNEAFAEITFLG